MIFALNLHGQSLFEKLFFRIEASGQVVVAPLGSKTILESQEDIRVARMETKWGETKTILLLS